MTSRFVNPFKVNEALASFGKQPVQSIFSTIFSTIEHSGIVVEPETIVVEVKPENPRGYEIKHKSGSCSRRGWGVGNAGRLNHALLNGEHFKAVCGTVTGRISHWADVDIDDQVTCPACIKKLQKLNLL